MPVVIGYHVILLVEKVIIVRDPCIHRPDVSGAVPVGIRVRERDV
jgi:hypothetical protein